MSSNGELAELYLAEDQRGQVLILTWTFTTLALVAVVGRIYIRYGYIKVGGSDDWWMLGGLVLLCTQAGILTAIAEVGGFKHEATLDSATKEYVKKLVWAVQPVGLVGSLLPKISIGLQTLQMMGDAPRFVIQRYTTWLYMSVGVVVNLLVFPIVFTQCVPLSALWDASSGGQCWPSEINTVFFTIAALINALIDFTLTAIPITIIIPLSISRRSKAVLLNFLLVRTFAGVASIIEASYIAKAGFLADDFSFNMANFLTWRSGELACLCCCGSVPTFKVLFDLWLRRRASARTANDGVESGTPRPGSEQDREWFYEKKCFEPAEQDGVGIDASLGNGGHTFNGHSGRTQAPKPSTTRVTTSRMSAYFV